MPHDILFSKLSFYGFGNVLFCWFYFYLKDWKQCLCINNQKIDFEGTILGAPHGSIPGPVLYNIFLTFFFSFSLCSSKASLHTFAGNNRLSRFSSAIKAHLSVLQSKCDKSNKRICNNDMVFSSDKSLILLE